MNNPPPETLQSPEDTEVSDSPDAETVQVEWASAADNQHTQAQWKSRNRYQKLRSPLFLNLVLPLLILAGAGIAFLLLGEKEAPQRPAADMSRAGILKRLPTSDVTPVRSLDDFGGRLNLSVEGVVVPFREVQLATEVAGQIVFKDPICEAGNFVQKGQLLFRIDPQDYQLDVDRLTQMREQEYQQLGEIDQEMTNAQRLLEVADQDLELRKREVKRLESLPQGFASEGELDQARRAELQALQERITHQNKIALLEKRRHRLETSERLAATQLELAQLNLDRTKIEAPVSGVIVQEDAELNSFVERGSRMITIEDTSKAEVAISLRMDQLHWVLDQQPDNALERASEDEALLVAENSRSYRLPETEATIEYSVAGREGEAYRWQGRLLRYDGIGLDPQTRTMPVRVVVDQPQQVIGPQEKPSGRSSPPALVRGMFVRVDLHIDPQTDLVVLPASSLKPGNRVWQFEQDESVLDVKANDAGTDTEPTPDEEATRLAGNQQPASKADDLSGETEPDAFDPEEWIAGSVRAIDAVRPIEAAKLAKGKLSAESNASARGSGADAPLSGEEIYWICEVAGQQLQAGDYVVTSPLSTVPGGGTTAVRVPAEQLRHPTRSLSEQVRSRSTAGIH